MRTIIAAAVAVLLAGPAGAEIIASCGPLAGHSYFYPHEFSKEPGWRDGSIKTTTIFVKSGDKLDLIIKGKNLLGEGTWTRSASDYGAPVVQVGGKAGEIMHILVAWGPDTELYSLDLKRKMVGLVAHKTSVADLTRAMVGRCE
ncbi:MAG: hypothetical protein OXC28_22170 [Defluviicoccus sp.]|nr:hypothetical protein [Defluviicoccus sp.]